MVCGHPNPRTLLCFLAFFAYLLRRGFFADLSERLKKKNSVLSIFAPLQQFYVHQNLYYLCTFAPAKFRYYKICQFAQIMIFYIIYFCLMIVKKRFIYFIAF